MEHAVAFAPKVEFSDPDALGTVFVNDTMDFNLREALEDGNGYIITDVPAVISRLSTYDPLKSVSLQEAQDAQAPKAKPAAAAPRPKPKDD